MIRKSIEEPGNYFGVGTDSLALEDSSPQVVLEELLNLCFKPNKLYFLAVDWYRKLDG